MSRARSAALLALSALAGARAQNAFNAGPVWRYDPTVMAATSGYAYNAGERPSENVPWTVMAELGIGGNACAASASFTNVSCALPPDVVTISWLIQSIVEILDVEQRMTLNTYMTVTHNDWRLAYAEGGVACWAASAGAALSGGGDAAAAGAYVQAALLAALQAAWGCTAASSCGPLLPAGVTPTVNVSVAGAALTVTVYPAPPAPGRDDPAGMTDALSASFAGILAAYSGAGTLAAADGAVAWTWASVLCTGADARRLPPHISLTEGVNTNGAAGSGSPAAVDPATMWDPELVDSLNQISDEALIAQQYFLMPNGDLKEVTHFVADYSISMRLEAYPFDAPYFIATRRSSGLHDDAIKLELGATGFAVPQQMEGWSVTDSGGMVCSVVAGGVHPCGSDAPEECQDVAVLYFQVTRDSAYFMQNQLAPIVLVTILSAAAYFNDVDAYDARATIMATSLLSQMALQAYVSGTLPQTSTTTYIHYALYTSYALMGFGIASIIVVSFGLALDVEAVKLLNVPREALPADASPSKRKLWKLLHSLPGGQPNGVKHWMLRLYYDEAVTFRRLLNGGDGDTDLLFFPDAAEVVAARSVRGNVAPMSSSMSAASAVDSRGVALARSEDEVYLEAPRCAELEKPLKPYCPKRIWLRRLIVDFDLFMRVGHLGVFALVLLSRYVAITRIEKERVTCDNLLDFFALP